MKSGRKVIAIAAAAALLGTTAVPAFAAEKITKDETVYVVTEADGSQNEVTVSDHLINEPGSDTIKDRSNLKDIENVKGDETFETGEKDALVWKAGGNDIFYQGTTDKDVPVRLGISYFLNDEEVQGNELEGADGDVKIVIDYRNTARSDNGTTVPFLAMTAFIAEDDSFTDIEIDHGKVIDDGDKQIVAAIAVPGLQDALNIDKDLVDLDLSDTVTITGTAKDFAIQDMMTVVTNSMFEEIDSDEFGDLDYDDQIRQLDKGAKALVDGSGELYDGVQQLDGGMGELSEGVAQLDKGAVTLRGSLKSQMKKIASSTGQLKDGTDTILSGMKMLKTGLDKGDGTPQNPGAINALDQIAIGLSNGSKQAGEGAKALNASADQLQTAADGAAQLNAGMKQAIEGYEKALQQPEAALEGLNGTLQQAGSIENIMKAQGLTDEEIAKLGPVIDMFNGYRQVANGESAIANEELKTIKYGLQPGAEKLEKGLKDAPAQLRGAAEQMSTSADDIGTAAGAVGQVKKGLEKASGSLGGYNKKLARQGKNQTTLIGGMTVINAGLDEMQTQVYRSVKKKGKLTRALNKLVHGTDELKDGTEQLEEGTAQLEDGSKQLSQGMSKIYKEGIKKIIDLYNDELKGTMNDLEDVLDAGQSYTTFTEKPSGMDGSVKFIYKTTVY